MYTTRRRASGYFVMKSMMSAQSLPFWSEAAGLEDEPPGIHTDDDRHRRV
jgi:hypothetical protein